MSLLGRYRKLRHMTVAEMQWRLAHRKLVGAERRAFRRGEVALQRADSGDACVAEDLCRRAADLLPGHRGSDLQWLAEDRPELHRRLQSQSLKRARRIQDGTITILGYNLAWQPLQPIDWQRDPRGEYRWPADFHGDVPVYNLSGETDVKYVWELNRHQFLVELGRGWLLTGQEEFVESVRTLLLDWIDKNPFLSGVNWTSGLEVAIRSLSWMWVLASTASWTGWGSQERQTIARSLAQHAQYLHRHLSFYTSPYNHLIGESTALYLLGIWLRGMGQAEQWQHKGRAVLEEYGPRQFYADGFSVEQAVGYHFFTLGFLCQAIVAARQLDRPLSKVEPAVARAFQTGHAMRQPNHRWPPIGDFDSARSLPVYPEDYWDFQGLCSLACALLDLPELKSDQEEAGAELYWLLGSEGVNTWDRIERRSSASCWQAVLPQAGYAVAGRAGRGEGDWFLFDAGPLADGLFADATPSTAHGHADVLQLLVCQQGTPILTDSGIASYAGDRARLEYMRGPAAHNTLEIDGAAVAQAAEGLAWSHVNRRVRLEANLSDDVWLARGRIEWPGIATVARTVLALPGCGVWIADFLEGLTNRTARWHWHLPQALGPLQTRDGQPHSGSAVRHARGVMVQWSKTPLEKLRAQLAEEGAVSGWQATAYGQPTQAYHVSYQRVISGRDLVVTFLGAAVVPAIVEVSGLALACGMTDTDGNRRPFVDELDSVRFVIDRGQNREVYVAGPLAHRPPEGYLSLGGKGDWPAAHQRCPTPAAVYEG